MPVVAALEHFFLVVYVAELFLRFFVMRLSCLRDMWVKFDLLLVVTGVMTAWIIEPFFSHMLEREGDERVTASGRVAARWSGALLSRAA